MSTIVLPGVGAGHLNRTITPVCFSTGWLVVQPEVAQDKHLFRWARGQVPRQPADPVGSGDKVIVPLDAPKTAKGGVSVMSLQASLACFLVLVAAVALGGNSGLAAQSQPTWGQLQPGPYSVGYKVMYELDHSRSWTEVSASDPIQEFSRPIRVSVWYPTTQVRATPTMSLREFVHDPAPDEYFARINELLEERYVGLFASASQRLYDSLLTLRLAAVKDAEPAVGSFPLVMYSPGGQASLPDNGVLAAFLASHGFIVGAVPQLEESPVLSGRDGYVTQVETQTRDIEFAMGVLQSFPQVDRRHLAVVGYSLGGLVALRMASRNPNVDAVVGLDPSFAYARNLNAVTGSGRLDIATLRMPILSLQAGNVESRSSFSPLIHDTLHFADRYTGYVSETVHGDFSEIKSMLIPALVSGEGLEPELLEAHRAYKVVCHYVVNFLDGVLKDVLDGLAFVAKSSAANGLEPDLVQMTLVSGIGVPTEAGFVELLTNEGYDAAEQLLRDAIRATPQVVLIREDVLDGIGRRMRGNGESSTAVGVFRLNAEAHPHSARAQDGLADAYLADGDSLQGIQTYRRLLEILPYDSTLSSAHKQELRRNAELKLRILQLGKR